VVDSQVLQQELRVDKAREGKAAEDTLQAALVAVQGTGMQALRVLVGVDMGQAPHRGDKGPHRGDEALLGGDLCRDDCGHVYVPETQHNCQSLLKAKQGIVR